MTASVSHASEGSFTNLKIGSVPEAVRLIFPVETIAAIRVHYVDSSNLPIPECSTWQSGCTGATLLFSLYCKLHEPAASVVTTAASTAFSKTVHICFLKALSSTLDVSMVEGDRPD